MWRASRSAPGTAAVITFRTDYDRTAPAHGRRMGSTRRSGRGDAGRAHGLWRRPGRPRSNHRGHACSSVFDQAGVVTSEAYDFKGNLLRSHAPAARTTRRRGRLEPNPCHWKSQVFTSSTTYDALNRPRDVDHAGQQRHPAHLQRSQPAGAGRGQPARRSDAATPFVTNIDYNAKGQRELIDYGNGVRTTYEYDPLTFR